MAHADNLKALYKLNLQQLLRVRGFVILPKAMFLRLLQASRASVHALAAETVIL